MLDLSHLLYSEAKKLGGNMDMTRKAFPYEIKKNLWCSFELLSHYYLEIP